MNSTRSFLKLKPDSESFYSTSIKTKNKYYPYIYSNDFNFFNKNTIRMKKIKKNMEKKIKHIIDSDYEALYANNNYHSLNNTHNTLGHANHFKNNNNRYLPLSISPVGMRKIDKKLKKIENSFNIDRANNDQLTKQNSPFFALGDLFDCVNNLNVFNEIKERPHYEIKTDKHIADNNKNNDNIFITDKINNQNNILRSIEANSRQMNKPDLNTIISSKINTINKLNKDKDNFHSIHRENAAHTLVTNTNTRRVLHTTTANSNYLYTSNRSNSNNVKATIYQEQNSYGRRTSKMPKENGHSPLENPFDIEKEYLGYRHQVKYPKLFYNHVGPFELKLNDKLGSISHSYGKIETKVKFTENPILKKYWKGIPSNNYELYKNLKILESKDTHKYKFKLKPLVLDNKIKNFDKLGNKVFNKKYLTDRKINL